MSQYSISHTLSIVLFMGEKAKLFIANFWIQCSTSVDYVCLLELELDSWWTRKLIGFWCPYHANICPITTWNCSLKVHWQHVVADYSSVEPLGEWRNTSIYVRITNVWKSLPFCVVTAPSVNSLKNRLDEHWASRELRYDWEAELSGTVSRSRVEFFEFTIICFK